jgi:hypothetical protein
MGTAMYQVDSTKVYPERGSMVLQALRAINSKIVDVVVKNELQRDQIEASLKTACDAEYNRCFGSGKAGAAALNLGGPNTPNTILGYKKQIEDITYTNSQLSTKYYRLAALLGNIWKDKWLMASNALSRELAVFSGLPADANTLKVGNDPYGAVYGTMGIIQTTSIFPNFPPLKAFPAYRTTGNSPAFNEFKTAVAQAMASGIDSSYKASQVKIKAASDAITSYGNKVSSISTTSRTSVSSVLSQSTIDNVQTKINEASAYINTTFSAFKSNITNLGLNDLKFNSAQYFNSTLNGMNAQIVNLMNANKTLTSKAKSAMSSLPDYEAIINAKVTDFNKCAVACNTIGTQINTSINALVSLFDNFSKMTPKTIKVPVLVTDSNEAKLCKQYVTDINTELNKLVRLNDSMKPQYKAAKDILYRLDSAYEGSIDPTKFDFIKINTTSMISIDSSKLKPLTTLSAYPNMNGLYKTLKTYSDGAATKAKTHFIDKAKDTVTKTKQYKDQLDTLTALEPSVTKPTDISNQLSTPLEAIPVENLVKDTTTYTIKTSLNTLAGILASMTNQTPRTPNGKNYKVYEAEMISSDLNGATERSVVTSSLMNFNPTSATINGQTVDISEQARIQGLNGIMSQKSNLRSKTQSKYTTAVNSMKTLTNTYNRAKNAMNSADSRISAARNVVNSVIGQMKRYGSTPTLLNQLNTANNNLAYANQAKNDYITAFNSAKQALINAGGTPS